MTISRHHVSFKTYALAFAVALSPALMQTSSCGSMYTLSELQLIASGQDRVDGFDPEVRHYDIALPAAAETAVVRAVSTNPSAEVWLDVEHASSETVTTPSIVGGGDFSIALEPGHTTISVSVKEGGITSFYTVSIGPGSLFPCTEQGVRDAVDAGGGPHTFACDEPTTIVTSSGIYNSGNVVLDGEGLITLDGESSSHTLFVNGGTAWLNGFTLTHSGLTEPPGSCRSTDAGGILNHGNLTLTNSTISGNYGSGVQCGDRGCGACGGGGIANGGWYPWYPAAVLTVENSVVAGNFAEVGGGIYNEFGVVTVTNSTVSGNVAIDRGGGVFSNRGPDPTSLFITGSTLSNNVAPEGGGSSIFSYGGGEVANTVIVGDCSASGYGISSLGNNIESPGDTCRFYQPTDQVNVSGDDLKLGPLLDNGGPTQTHALGEGSVAIDWISEADCVDADGAPVKTDQRGVTRPQGGNCDVGAFEYADCSSSCDDVNDCTADFCDPLASDPWCVHIAAPDGTSCQLDGLAGVCSSGTCIEDQCVDPAVCDDDNDCTTDTCDPFSVPWCANLSVPDRTLCNFLGLAGVCNGGTCVENHCVDPNACGDGNECTADICDSLSTPWCLYPPANTGDDCDAPGGLGVCFDGGCVESSWGTAELVETEPGPVYPNQGQAVVDPSGNVMGVWQQGDNIWANRYEPGVGWGDAEMIGTGTRPQVAVDPTGVATAVWATPTAIWSNRYTPETGWGMAEPIEASQSSSSREPRVAVDSRGIATVVWFRYDGGPGYDIWSNRYTPGLSWGDAEIVGSSGTSASNPVVAVDATGHVTVVWAASNGIWSNRHAPAVGWGVAEAIAGAGSAPQVVVEPTGVATAIWATGFGIRSSQYIPGVGWGVAEAVGIETPGTSWTDMLMVVDAAGYVTAVWAANGDAWANRFTPGVGWGIAEVMGAGGSYPWVTAEPGGRAMAVWATDVGSRNELVWSRRYTPGVGWASAEPIRDARARTLVVMDSSGAAMAGWVANGHLWSNRAEAP